jgi:hypothetical protein
VHPTIVRAKIFASVTVHKDGILGVAIIFAVTVKGFFTFWFVDLVRGIDHRKSWLKKNLCVLCLLK